MLFERFRIYAFSQLAAYNIGHRRLQEGVLLAMSRADPKDP